MSLFNSLTSDTLLFSFSAAILMVALLIGRYFSRYSPKPGRLKPVEQWPHSAHAEIPPTRSDLKLVVEHMKDELTARDTLVCELRMAIRAIHGDIHSPGNEEIVERALSLTHAFESSRIKELEASEKKAVEEKEKSDSFIKSLRVSIEADNAELQRLRESEKKAVEFATRMEREDISFAKLAGEQLKIISELPLGKGINENLSDAVKRVLEQRDEAIKGRKACDRIIMEERAAAVATKVKVGRLQESYELWAKKYEAVSQKLADAIRQIDQLRGYLEQEKDRANSAEIRCSQLASDWNKESVKLLAQVEASSALVAEQRRVLERAHSVFENDTSRKCEVMGEIEAALAMTPVSMGAELERLRDELSRSRYLNQMALEERDRFGTQLAAEMTEVKRLREQVNKTASSCNEYVTEDDGSDMIPDWARISNAFKRLTKQLAAANATNTELSQHLIEARSDCQDYERKLSAAKAEHELLQKERDAILAHLAALVNAGNGLRMGPTGSRERRVWDAAIQGVLSGYQLIALNPELDCIEIPADHPARKELMALRRSEANLLNIVRMAYLHQLDRMAMPDSGPRRLTKDQERQLGRDLAIYGVQIIGRAQPEVVAISKAALYRDEMNSIVRLVIPESHHEAACAESVLWQAEQIRSYIYSLQSDKTRLDLVDEHRWSISWNERANGFIIQANGQVVGHICSGPTIRSAMVVSVKP